MNAVFKFFRLKIGLLNLHKIVQINLNIFSLELINSAHRISTRIASNLDGIRFFLLKLLRHIHVFHQAYASRPVRLGLRFLFLTFITLPLAMVYPEMLLIGGPILFGYIHLVASYRYVGRTSRLQTNSLKQNGIFKIFATTTLVSILLRILLEKSPLLDDVPFGVWEASVATLLLLFISWQLNQLTIKRALISTCLLGLVAYCAFLDPLIFIGVTLFVHNWVAMIYWISTAPNWRDKSAAICSTCIFAALHYLVFEGTFDHFFRFHPIGEGGNSELQITGWILMPWSKDPLLWSRAIVLYTYGLSIHYFAWLSAIPECCSNKEYPNSFRISWQQLRHDLGRTTCLLMIGVTIFGVGIWLFSYPVGKNIYFSLATLHGWIEILFLL